MRSTKTVITCDSCSAVIPDHSEVAEILGKDICKTCLIKLHDDVDTEFHRIVRGEVATRRGGWRKLGDPADT